jgi:hypothetical protein
MQSLGRNIRIWNGSLSKPVARNYRIAICTTCMNRLDDLRQTLPANLDNSKDYANLQFVLLDYNSSDGLGHWVRRHLAPHIDSGRLVYFRTEQPLYYEMAHSRNVAFGLADADLVTNVDADCFAHRGFVPYLNTLANQLAERAVFVKSWQRMNGRVAFFKREWQELGGYDESFVGYGYDDTDLVLRALAQRFTLARFGGQWCRRLPTPSRAKVVNMQAKQWRRTQETNKQRSDANLKNGIYRANAGLSWGRATLVRNFRDTFQVEQGGV